MKLGEILRIEPQLAESVNALDEVVVSIDPIMNSDRTGSATNIDREQIDALPSISRSASDFTRLTPSPSGNSFGSRNNQFNNFSLDGSIFNNPFGLEGWAVKDGMPYSTGTFSSVTGSDDASPYSGPMASPPFPGEDFVQGNASFPTNLRGGKVVVSVEPYPDNSPMGTVSR